MNRKDMITQKGIDATVVGSIIRKVKQFVEINCKYPYPEERYFTEIANRCITDAHGTSNPQLTSLETQKLWYYLKQQALQYVVKVQKELEVSSLNDNQKDYYSHKFDTDSSKIDCKLATLNDQFSDGNDQINT